MKRSVTSQLTGISSNTLIEYLRKYQDCGIEGLKEVNFYQSQSELGWHTTTIEYYFIGHRLRSFVNLLILVLGKSNSAHFQN